jgi:predicted PurR-regulated permease PerM
MSLLDRTTLRILFTVLATLGTLALVWLARKPLLAFLFAMLFAYLLEPLVAQLQRWLRSSRGIAIAVTYVAMLTVLLVAGLLVGPRVVEQGQNLYQSAPELYSKVASGNIAYQLGRARGWSYQTQAALQQLIASHRDEVFGAVSAQGAKVTAIAANAFWLLLIPILAIFFLKDKSHFARGFESLLDDPHRRLLLSSILSDLDEMLSHFVRAQVYLAAISTVVYLAILTLMRVPYSWALGTLGGLLEFIPFVGPLLTAAVILTVCFGLNYGHLGFVLLFLLLWRGLQDYLISPRILGGRVEVHPLAAIFGVLAGGEIAGVVGIYFAVPVMAAARILWIRWRQRTRGPDAAIQDTGFLTPPS